MSDIVASTVADRRFLMVLVVTYALLALMIASIGIFGVAAYQVEQRTPEFGVRLALGASAFVLLRLVIVQSVRVGMIGIIAGLFISFATNRLMSNQLFGLSPYDPILLASVSLLLLSLCVIAALLPARQAAKTDPMTALRHE